MVPHSDQTRKEAIRLVIEDGLSVAKASRLSGVPRSTLDRWVKQRSRTSPPKKKTPHPEADREALVRLVVERKIPVTVVARWGDVPRTTLNTWVVEAHPTYRMTRPRKKPQSRQRLTPATITQLLKIFQIYRREINQSS